MKDKRHIIFDQGECISEDMLLRYVNDQLTAKEKHVVEKHMLECELCADALEGLMQMKDPSKLKGIVENLNKKISESGEGRKPIMLWMNTVMAIAAGLALLIGLFFIFNDRLKDASENKTLSDNLKQKEEPAKSLSDKEESFKTESTPTSPDQDQATGKVSSTIETKKIDKSGEHANFGQEGKGIISGGNGNAPISKNTQGGLSRSEGASPRAPLEEQKQSLNDITIDDRSKSAEEKVLSEPKRPVAKDVKSWNDEIVVSNNETSITNENLKQVPAQQYAVTNKSNNYLSKKSEAPRRDETEHALSTGERRKDKNKNPETAAAQESIDKVNMEDGDGKADYAGIPPPVSPNGNAAGAAAAPGRVPQSTASTQDIVSLRSAADEGAKKNVKHSAKVDADSYRNDIKAGDKKYKSKEYDQAILLFTKILQTKPADRKALYFLGCSYLELSKSELAIVQFDKLIELGTGVYYDGARYNKAIALIKQNKNAEAKILLEGIIKTSDEYKSRAAKTLDDIK